MTYPYGMRGAPVVGKGLGGLPKRNNNDIRGEITFAVPGLYSWTPPKGVRSVCVVCVGGAGAYPGVEGGGGGLGWKNNIPVIPGVSYTVRVGLAGLISNGGDSYFISSDTVCGYGGSSTGTGGSHTGDGGGNGGDNGGGAGGYSGDGGDGGGAAPDGGGGGGITTYGGAGGVGLFGEGESGTAGTGGSGGENGHAGSNGNYSGVGGQYGGAGNYVYANAIGGHGAVRIIWGAGRAFPSTDCGQS